MEESKYYTPKIEEFKQGFKFEFLKKTKGEKTTGWVFFNKDGNTEINWNYAEKDEWFEMEVWWDRDPKIQKVIFDDGTIIEYKEIKLFDLVPPINILKSLENGKIRAKR